MPAVILADICDASEISERICPKIKYDELESRLRKTISLYLPSIAATFL